MKRGLLFNPFSLYGVFHTEEELAKSINKSFSISGGEHELGARSIANFIFTVYSPRKNELVEVYLNYGLEVKDGWAVHARRRKVAK